jgi:hypothetical protein
MNDDAKAAFVLQPVQNKKANKVGVRDNDRADHIIACESRRRIGESSRTRATSGKEDSERRMFRLSFPYRNSQSTEMKKIQKWTERTPSVSQTRTPRRWRFVLASYES